MSSAFERLRDVMHDHGVVKETGSESFMAQCPGHEDNNPSLHVKGIEGRVLLHCFAGCSTGDLLAAIGWQMRDLYDDPRGGTWVYPGGRQVHKTPEKRFRQSGIKTDTSLYCGDQIGDAMVVYVSRSLFYPSQNPRFADETTITVGTRCDSAAFIHRIVKQDNMIRASRSAAMMSNHGAGQCDPCIVGFGIPVF